jgi:hypothetical protein
MTSQPEPPPPAEPLPPGWEDILQKGERILWQGRPERGIAWSELVDPKTPFGLFFAGFAAFWIYTAASMGRGTGIGGVFPLFGIPFLLVGLHLAFGRVFWSAYARGRTHYTLTDRTAFIATEVMGRRRLARHDLGPEMALTLDDGDPGAVWFGEEVTHHPGGFRGAGSSRRYRAPSTTRRRIGFERIAGARRVYRLMTDALAAQKAGPPE